ncbi:hypothetical protein HDV06_006348 [Boothiomyces sp. JEL0866]|nr:hypothetical protein HDV06_006348 [Boothiomyces sp. JEL0866]
MSDNTMEDLVYGVGLSLSFISTVCSVITMFKIIKKWKVSGSFPMSLRFPLYIAIADLLMYITIYINQLKNVFTGSDWDGVMCSGIATCFGFTVYLNMGIFAAVLFQLYANIVLNIKIDFGKGDYKLFIFVCTVSAGISLGSIPTTGQDPFWCFDKMHGSDKTIEILAICISSILFDTICFCGFKVFLALKSPDFSRNKSKVSQITEMTTRKILTYVIVFILEWTPQVPVMFGGILNYYSDWIYLVSNIGLGSGGFLMNERLKERIAINSVRVIETPNNQATIAIPQNTS